MNVECTDLTDDQDLLKIIQERQRAAKTFGPVSSFRPKRYHVLDNEQTCTDKDFLPLQ